MKASLKAGWLHNCTCPEEEESLCDHHHQHCSLRPEREIDPPCNWYTVSEHYDQVFRWFIGFNDDSIHYTVISDHDDGHRGSIRNLPSLLMPSFCYIAHYYSSEASSAVCLPFHREYFHLPQSSQILVYRASVEIVLAVYNATGDTILVQIKV